MEQLAFYVVSDIHGYIFPTDFSKRDQYLPMGLLLANHLIEKTNNITHIILKLIMAIFTRLTIL